MARRIRSAQLETRTQRLKLAPRWKPYSVSAGPGVRLAYRRKATTGRWSVLCADGRGGNWLKAFADADDFEDANGNTILDYGQALDRARLLARGDTGNAGGDGKPITLNAALSHYEADLRARGGRVANVARVRGHLPDGLRHKPVVLLTADELRQWRNVLGKTLTNGSINRVASALRAALNLAADHDPRLAAARPGLEGWAQGHPRCGRDTQRHFAGRNDPPNCRRGLRDQRRIWPAGRDRGNDRRTCQPTRRPGSAGRAA